MLKSKVLFLATLLLSMEGIGCVPACAQTDKPGGSQSVSMRLDAARSVALALKEDAVNLTEVFRTGVSGPKQPEKDSRLSRDTILAKETSTELQEMQAIASVEQAATIRLVTPLLGEMLANSQSMMEHMSEVRSEAELEYLRAHQEIAIQLAARIVSAIDHGSKQK
jgi:hypothetical protein